MITKNIMEEIIKYKVYNKKMLIRFLEKDGMDLIKDNIVESFVKSDFVKIFRLLNDNLVILINEIGDREILNRSGYLVFEDEAVYDLISKEGRVEIGTNRTKSVFELNKYFLLNIHKDKKQKLNDLFIIIGKEFSDLKSYKAIEEITSQVMRRLKKSDHNFLLWLHCIGVHINLKYNTKWILYKVEGREPVYMPAVMDINGVIWQIGLNCHLKYYKGQRMSGISFEFFYKTVVEKSIFNTKLENFKKESIVILDDFNQQRE